ncbi:MAG: ABC transporter permease [Muribaculaceae bacterium]|nr:ABC transporter permease [Muribaculaceae bacterium]
MFSKKTHSAVNKISLISVLGVAVATMAIVCVLSVFNGFEDVAAKSLSQFDPQLKIYPSQGKVIENADSLINVIEKIDGINAAIPAIDEQAFAIFNNQQMPITLKGISSRYANVYAIDSIVIDGTFLLQDDDYDYASLSVGAAIGLMARANSSDYISIYVPSRTGRINPANPMTAFCADSLAIASVFQVNQPEYDTDCVIIPIENARTLLEYTTQASTIDISLNHAHDIDDMKEMISIAIGDGYVIKDRYQQQEQSFKMIEIEKWITFFMLAFILIIASFNIISTLSMLIIEKDENIATFNALGASKKIIARIFMIEGWLISLVGGVVGIVIGVILCLAQQYGKFIKLNGDPSEMIIDAYPVRVEFTDLFVVLTLVLIVGFVTSQITSIFTRQRLKN